FILSSYWAFNRALLPSQVGLGKNGASNPDTLTLGGDYSVIPNYDTICLNGVNDQYQIASVWVVPPGTENGPPTSPAAVGFDALVSHGVQKRGTTILEFPWDVHGALFIEHSNCTAALKRAIAYAQPEPLTIGARSVLPSGLDGIYGGDP